MKVDIYQREKIEVGKIPSCECFKLIDSDICFKIVTLIKEEAFKPILRDDVIYAADLATGELYIYEKTMVVYQINLKVVEIEKDQLDV